MDKVPRPTSLEPRGYRATNSMWRILEPPIPLGLTDPHDAAIAFARAVPGMSMRVYWEARV